VKISRLKEDNQTLRKPSWKPLSLGSVREAHRDAKSNGERAGEKLRHSHKLQGSVTK
jgi:hypothetical protein